MVVWALSSGTGFSVLQNHNTKQSVSHQFDNVRSPLCRTDAEWIVEDFTIGEAKVPFINFGNITFTNATASGDEKTGVVSPVGGHVWDIIDANQNNKIITDCGTNGPNEMYCNYIG